MRRGGDKEVGELCRYESLLLYGVRKLFGWMDERIERLQRTRIRVEWLTNGETLRHERKYNVCILLAYRVIYVLLFTMQHV